MNEEVKMVLSGLKTNELFKHTPYSIWSEKNELRNLIIIIFHDEEQHLKTEYQFNET